MFSALSSTHVGVQIKQMMLYTLLEAFKYAREPMVVAVMKETC